MMNDKMKILRRRFCLFGRFGYAAVMFSLLLAGSKLQAEEIVTEETTWDTVAFSETDTDTYEYADEGVDEDADEDEFEETNESAFEDPAEDADSMTGGIIEPDDDPEGGEWFDEEWFPEETVGEDADCCIIEEQAETEADTELFEDFFQDEVLAADDGYFYEIEPVIAPFNKVFYVKTDNPDPGSFRFYDTDSSFLGKDTDDSRTCSLLKKRYADVVYENESTYRVNGGYIFYCPYGDIDGGELVLQTKSDDGSWISSSAAVQCQAVTNEYMYLIQTYTDSRMTFFEKMDAVQNALDSIAIYPKYVYDPNQQGYIKYPALACSTHPDTFSLNLHTEIYKKSDRQSFLISFYPYVLDSASFPKMLSDLAYWFDPSCTVEMYEISHAHRVITCGAESRIYGGQGEGSSRMIYLGQLTGQFTFSQTENDPAAQADLLRWKAVYEEYEERAKSNAEERRSLISGDKLANSIGSGSWVRVCWEGRDATTYSYMTRDGDSGSGMAYAVSDTFVDGRYVNEYEAIELDVTLEDHPHAAILLRNQTWTDYYGKVHTGDITYFYRESSDRWEAESEWAGGGIYFSAMNPLPDEFILTHDQVDRLMVDGNSNRLPENGLIYDGTVFPGTPFANIPLQGVSLPEAYEIMALEREEIPHLIVPSDATHIDGTWVIDDESIVRMEGYTIVAKHPGTTTVFFKAADGGFTSSCTITVFPREAMIQEGRGVTASTAYAGERISDISYSHPNLVDKKTGSALFTEYELENPSEILSAGIREVSWIAYPYDYIYKQVIPNEYYTPVRGTMQVKVLKRDPVLISRPCAMKTEHQEGNRLDSVAITDGKMNVPGTWEWVNGGDVLRAYGGWYSCVFHPEKPDLYNEKEEQVWVYADPAPAPIETEHGNTQETEKTPDVNRISDEHRTPDKNPTPDENQNPDKNQTDECKRIIEKLNKGKLSVKTKTVVVRYAKLRKKKQVIKPGKVFVIQNTAGKVSYEKTRGNRKITVSKTGKITIGKGLKKGTYKIKVKITDHEDKIYKKKSKTVTIKIRVK